MIGKIDLRIIKFAAAGLINTGADWLIYFATSRLLFGPGWEAKVCGVGAGIISAFILNASWVFRHEFIAGMSAHPRTFGSFAGYCLSTFTKMVLAYGFGMFINLGAFLLVMRMGAPELVALVFATFCSLLVNFFFSNKFVFRVSPTN